MMNTVQYNFMKLIFLVTILVAGSGVVRAAGGYPDMQVSGPTDQFPAEFAAFNPPVDPGYVISEGAPEIAEWTRQNEPGDTLALTGEALSVYSSAGEEGRDTRFVIHGEGYTLVDGMIQRLNGRMCAITLPESLPENEMYLMWPRNEHGFGAPVGINQTEAWWIGSDLLERGETFSVYGRNLDLGDGLCQVYIDGYGWLDNNGTSNPYKVDFVVPESLENGAYTVYVHNGHGGSYGWSPDGIQVTVQDDVKWSDDRATWYNVKDYGAVGDGVTDDTAAIIDCVNAARAGSDFHTVYFPKGTYLVSSTIYPNDQYLRYKGDGMDVSTVQASSVSWGDHYGAVFMVNSNTSFEDLGIRKGDLSKTLITAQGGGARRKNIYLNRVKLSTLSPGPLRKTDGGSALSITTAENFKATDCVFITDYGIELGTTKQLHFERCEFIGIGDCNGLASFSGSEFALVDCYAHPMDASDTTDGLGWAKGRWIYGGGYINKVYIGGNVSSNMAPRSPDYEFSEVCTAITGPTAAYATNYFHFKSGDLSTIEGVGRMAVASGDRGIRGYKVISIDVDNRIVGIKRDWYDGEFPVNTLCQIRETVDQNSGEQFLWEAMNAYYRGSPSEVSSASSLVFSDLEKDYDGWTFMIASGRGMGQTSKISGTTANGVVTLETPLRVLPDSSSVCKIGKFLDRVVSYDNDLNGPEYAGKAGHYSATSGFNCYGGGSRLVIDGNRFGNMRSGLMLWAGCDAGDTAIIQPNLFSVVKDNIIDSCQYGITHTIQDWGRDIEKDVTFYGHVTRGNSLINSTIVAFSDSVSDGRMRKDLCVFERNAFSANARFVSSSDENVHNQVWIGNSVNQVNGTGLPVSGSGSYALQNNEWIGLSSIYDGDYSAGILELPTRVVYLNQSVSTVTVPVWNSGTDALSWSVDASGVAWLTAIPSSGTVLNEQSGMLTLSLSSIPTTDTHAVITVSGGSMTKDLMVYYSSAQIVSSSEVVYPLTGFSGEKLRVILTDDTTGAVRELGEVQNQNELRIDNLIPGHWYTLVFEEYIGASGDWVAVRESHFKM